MKEATESSAQKGVRRDPEEEAAVETRGPRGNVGARPGSLCPGPEGRPEGGRAPEPRAPQLGLLEVEVVLLLLPRLEVLRLLLPLQHLQLLLPHGLLPLPLQPQLLHLGAYKKMSGQRTRGVSCLHPVRLWGSLGSGWDHTHGLAPAGWPWTQESVWGCLKRWTHPVAEGALFLLETQQPSAARATLATQQGAS